MYKPEAYKRRKFSTLEENVMRAIHNMRAQHNKSLARKKKKGKG